MLPGPFVPVYPSPGSHRASNVRNGRVNGLGDFRRAYLGRVVVDGHDFARQVGGHAADARQSPDCGG